MSSTRSLEVVRELPTPEVDAELVELAERLLEEVKAGDVSALAFASLDSHGYVSTAFSIDFDRRASVFTMAGGVACLQSRLQSYIGEDD